MPAGCPAPSPESQGAMKGESVRRKVVITNPQGFHLRPLAAFAETALRFQSRVSVIKDGVGVDGKSPVALMGLGAAPGTELVLEATGPDAAAALDALLEVLTSLATAQEVPEAPPSR
ncbi:MAG TPA: HPr family phosphocarrier protein [Gemmataceae bacterium]|nr:HPr family phosphocarrier protein [Gemmataceae bacterium]